MHIAAAASAAAFATIIITTTTTTTIKSKCRRLKFSDNVYGCVELKTSSFCTSR